jgi:hypothetical protein
MKFFSLAILVLIGLVSITNATSVNNDFNISAIHNAHGNAMTHIAQQSATQFANPLNVTHHVLSQKTQFAM